MDPDLTGEWSGEQVWVDAKPLNPKDTTIP